MKYSVKYKTDTSLIDRMLEEIGKHDPLPDIEDKSTPIKVELKPHIYYVDCANLGEEGNDKYIPERVIFSPPATICFFQDGEKIVSRCTDGDEFDELDGLRACITKRVLGNNSQLRKLARKAYWQPKEEK